jgi:hypothetical protein
VTQAFAFFFFLLKLSGTAGYSSPRRKEKRLSEDLIETIEETWDTLKRSSQEHQPKLQIIQTSF